MVAIRYKIIIPEIEILISLNAFPVFIIVNTKTNDRFEKRPK
jgi:hypothetical protein